MVCGKCGLIDITLASGRCDGNGYARWIVKMVSGKCESIDIGLASGRCGGNSYLCKTACGKM
jgi:hypothetical protein